MSGSINGSSTGSGSRIEPHELSYGEVATFSSGGIISKQMKMDLRKQNGYCGTCPLVPVLLVDIRRSRINPLWISRKPRTKEGECLEGRCLKCSRDKDANHGKRPTIASSPSFHSRSTQSFASSISSCSTGSLGTLHVASVESDQLCSQRGIAKSFSSVSQVQLQQGGYVQRDSKLPPRPARTSSEDSSDRYCSIGLTRRAPLSREISENSSMQQVVEKRASVECTRIDSTCRDKSYDLAWDSTDSFWGKQQGKSVIAESQNRSFQSLSLTSKLHEIQTKLSDMKNLESRKVFTEYLLATMDTNYFDESIQKHCLATIHEDLTTGALDGNAFVAANGTSRILVAMKAFPTSLTIQELGCDALIALATNECNSIDMIRQDACLSLCRILDLHSKEITNIEKVFVALRMLSTINEGRLRMLQIHLSNIVVAAMQCNLHSPAIQQDGCAILSNMSVDVKNNEVSVIGTSELTVIVEAMQVHSNDESVLASACFALKNFSYNSLNLRNMNRTSSMIEVLEQASSFYALSIAAEQTIEKLYISLAQDESLEDHARKELMVLVAEESDDPNIMEDILKKLKEFKWSSRLVSEWLQILKSLALTSIPHKLKLVDNLTLDELRYFTNEFPFVDLIKVEVSSLARCYEGSESLLN
jgi:hypothetical protein